MPWEMGLVERHLTLKLNGLRHKVTLETDGKMMSGRDVVSAARLGEQKNMDFQHYHLYLTWVVS